MRFARGDAWRPAVVEKGEAAGYQALAWAFVQAHSEVWPPQPAADMLRMTSVAGHASQLTPVIQSQMALIPGSLHADAASIRRARIAR